MTAIDSALASLLASRMDSLIEGVAAGSRVSTVQTGASAQAGASAQTSEAASAQAAVLGADAALPASAQATLSEMALTLDAISRFGGEVTPGVIGETPIWPSPPAIDAPGAQLPGTGTGTGAAGASAGLASPASAAAAATTSAAVLPVEALAAALEQVVAETGLFYESHLAQWLAGEYSPEALLAEPQTRLAAQDAQLPLDWSDPAAVSQGSALDLLLSFGTQTGPSPGTAALPLTGVAQWFASQLASQVRAGISAYASTGQSPNSPTGAALADLARAGGGATASAGRGVPGGSPASVVASIHPATIPLVRQQLDLLATQQFRWTGEVWPGAKLDWTIEPERQRYPRGGAGSGGEDASNEQAWRTRLTLALPTLGTVDADLVLTGTQLVVRVQANPAGAARLAAGGEAFGRKLQAAGIELAGLSIREVGGAEPATAGAAHAAASAYARAAATAADAQAHEVPATDDAAAFSRAAAAAGDGRRAAPSPLDHLFDDPFDWSGA